MKTRHLFYAFSIALFFGCSGSSTPFGYIDNTRIILEGYIVNQNGIPVANHNVELTSSSSELPVVGTATTDASGRFFLSTPQANYAYSLKVGVFSIISSERFANLLKSNPQDLPNFIPVYENTSGLYYNFGTIKIKKP